MILTLYQCDDDIRKVDKTLTIVETHTNVHLKKPCTLEDPVFIITGVAESEGKPKRFNYVKCDYFNDRFYYIVPGGIKFCPGNVMEITCHHDVLRNYVAQINQANATVIRQANRFFKDNQQKNGIFFDAEYPIRADVTTYSRTVGEVVDTEVKYYLTVNGGVQ